MMEFTVSRAVLCMAGVMMLAAVTGTLSGVYNTDVDRADGELAERMAFMLDSFESSQMDVLILEGSQILRNGSSISVHDCIVELHSGDAVHTAVTKYPGEFRLDYTETLEITRRTSPLSS